METGRDDLQAYQLIGALARVRTLEHQLDEEREALKSTRATLEIANNYLKDVLGSVSDVLLVVDEERYILTANQTALQMLGYEEHELLGEQLSFVSTDLRDIALDVTVQVEDATGRGSLKSEIVLSTKDERRIPALFSVSRLQDPYGDVVYICTATDISERLRLETELRHAQRLESLGQLAAGVAHEINNPLGYVIGNLDYVLDELPPPLIEQFPEVAVALRQASEGAIRVREVVRDLLSFSRSSTDRVAAADVQDVIESTIRLTASQVKQRTKLQCHYRQVPNVRANGPQLGQVLLNLVMNAVQALPEDRFADNLLVLATFMDDEGRVVIEVRDNGPGISPEVQARIFNPFFTTKPVGQGTGLGLSICREIIERFGGVIKVESQMGVGTAFQVFLWPMSDGVPQEVPDIDSGLHRQVTDAIAVPRLSRVLVVDDEDNVRASLGRFLNRHFDVDLAENGRVALDKIDGNADYDAVVCDLIMPEMTGMDLYERLRASRPALAEQMVFITGGAFTDKARMFLELVSNPVLHKPFELRELRTAIDEQIDAQTA